MESLGFGLTLDEVKENIKAISKSLEPQLILDNLKKLVKFLKTQAIKVCFVNSQGNNPAFYHMIVLDEAYLTSSTTFFTDECKIVASDILYLLTTNRDSFSWECCFGNSHIAGIPVILKKVYKNNQHYLKDSIYPINLEFKETWVDKTLRFVKSAQTRYMYPNMQSREAEYVYEWILRQSKEVHMGDEYLWTPVWEAMNIFRLRYQYVVSLYAIEWSPYKYVVFEKIKNKEFSDAEYIAQNCSTPKPTDKDTVYITDTDNTDSTEFSNGPTKVTKKADRIKRHVNEAEFVLTLPKSRKQRKKFEKKKKIVNSVPKSFIMKSFREIYEFVNDDASVTYEMRNLSKNEMQMIVGFNYYTPSKVPTCLMFDKQCNDLLIEIHRCLNEKTHFKLLANNGKGRGLRDKIVIFRKRPCFVRNHRNSYNEDTEDDEYDSSEEVLDEMFDDVMEKLRIQGQKETAHSEKSTAEDMDIYEYQCESEVFRYSPYEKICAKYNIEEWFGGHIELRNPKSILEKMQSIASQPPEASTVSTNKPWMPPETIWVESGDKEVPERDGEVPEWDGKVPVAEKLLASLVNTARKNVGDMEVKCANATSKTTEPQSKAKEGRPIMKRKLLENQSSLDRDEVKRNPEPRAKDADIIPTMKTKLIEGLSMPLESDKAMRMMRLMGWNGGALGVRGNGLIEPITPMLDLKKRVGLGHKMSKTATVIQAAKQSKAQKKLNKEKNKVKKAKKAKDKEKSKSDLKENTQDDITSTNVKGANVKNAENNKVKSKTADKITLADDEDRYTVDSNTVETNSLKYSDKGSTCEVTHKGDKITPVTLTDELLRTDEDKNIITDGIPKTDGNKNSVTDKILKTSDDEKLVTGGIPRTPGDNNLVTDLILGTADDKNKVTNETPKTTDEKELVTNEILRGSLMSDEINRADDKNAVTDDKNAVTDKMAITADEKNAVTDAMTITADEKNVVNDEILKTADEKSVEIARKPIATSASEDDAFLHYMTERGSADKTGRMEFLVAVLDLVQTEKSFAFLWFSQNVSKAIDPHIHSMIELFNERMVMTVGNDREDALVIAISEEMDAHCDMVLKIERDQFDRRVITIIKTIKGDDSEHFLIPQLEKFLCPPTHIILNYNNYSFANVKKKVIASHILMNRVLLYFAQSDLTEMTCKFNVHMNNKSRMYINAVVSLLNRQVTNIKLGLGSVEYRIFKRIAAMMNDFFLLVKYDKSHMKFSQIKLVKVAINKRCDVCQIALTVDKKKGHVKSSKEEFENSEEVSSDMDTSESVDDIEISLDEEHKTFEKVDIFETFPNDTKDRIDIENEQVTENNVIYESSPKDIKDKIDVENKVAENTFENNIFYESSSKETKKNIDIEHKELVDNPVALNMDIVEVYESVEDTNNLNKHETNMNSSENTLTFETSLKDIKVKNGVENEEVTDNIVINESLSKETKDNIDIEHKESVKIPVFHNMDVVEVYEHFGDSINSLNADDKNTSANTVSSVSFLRDIEDKIGVENKDTFNPVQSVAVEEVYEYFGNAPKVFNEESENTNEDTLIYESSPKRTRIIDKIDIENKNLIENPEDCMAVDEVYEFLDNTPKILREKSENTLIYESSLNESRTRDNIVEVYESFNDPTNHLNEVYKKSLKDAKDEGVIETPVKTVNRINNDEVLRNSAKDLNDKSSLGSVNFEFIPKDSEENSSDNKNKLTERSKITKEKIEKVHEVHNIEDLINTEPEINTNNVINDDKTIQKSDQNIKTNEDIYDRIKKYIEDFDKDKASSEIPNLDAGGYVIDNTVNSTIKIEDLDINYSHNITNNVPNIETVIDVDNSIQNTLISEDFSDKVNKELNNVQDNLNGNLNETKESFNINQNCKDKVTINQNQYSDLNEIIQSLESNEKLEKVQSITENIIVNTMSFSNNVLNDENKCNGAIDEQHENSGKKQTEEEKDSEIYENREINNDEQNIGTAVTKNIDCNTTISDEKAYENSIDKQFQDIERMSKTSSFDCNDNNMEVDEENTEVFNNNDLINETWPKIFLITSKNGHIMDVDLTAHVQMIIYEAVKITQGSCLPRIEYRGIKEKGIVYYCQNKKSFIWLRDLLLSDYNISEYMNNNDAVVIDLTIRSFIEIDIDIVLRNIEMLYSKINTRSWNVIQNKVLDECCIFTIEIDCNSLELIRKEQYLLFVGFDRAEVIVVNDYIHFD